MLHNQFLRFSRSESSSDTEQNHIIKRIKKYKNMTHPDLFCHSTRSGHEFMLVSCVSMHSLASWKASKRQSRCNFIRVNCVCFHRAAMVTMQFFQYGDTGLCLWYWSRDIQDLNLVDYCTDVDPDNGAQVFTPSTTATPIVDT